MKKTVINIFLMFISWLIYSTFFCIIYYFIANPIIYGWGEGFRVIIQEMKTLNAHRILAVIFLLFFVVSLLLFFILGRRVFSKQNLALDLVSCFLPHSITAIFILRSPTTLAVTRPLLEVFTIPIIFTTQDISNYLNCFDFVALYNKGTLCREVTTSNVNNALFSLIPFIISFVGVRVKNKFRIE